MNQKQRLIKECEDKGRNLFQHFAIQNPDTFIHKFMDQQFEHYDAIFDYQDYLHLMGEVKFREYYADDFNEWWIETDKSRLMFRESIKANPNKENHHIAYINIFKENLIAMWILSQEDIQNLNKSIQKCPQSKWNPTLVDKEVGHLKLSQAIIFKKIK